MIKSMSESLTLESPAVNVREAKNHRPVGWWLLVCCVFVFLVMVVGGITRLTESGLSIVEWAPVSGALPPMTAEHWQEEFTKYRQSPQYQKINRGMSLGEFKTIYWWEWGHRLLGRMIGVVFFVPFLYFLLRHQIPAGMRGRLILIFLLGGVQGAIGWYMVRSGLVHDPYVSQYRLALHLGMAFLLFGLMFWTALQILRPGEARSTALSTHTSLLSALIFIQVLLGALVAGLDAGLASDTFPLMQGRLIPPGLFELSPGWLNFFENPLTVQWTHRVVGLLLSGYILWFWWNSRKQDETSGKLVHWLALAAILQVALGVLTLLYHVPIALASAHQATAMILFAFGLAISYEHRYIVKNQGERTGCLDEQPVEK